MLEIREYIDELGRSRYRRWVETLEYATQARIVRAIAQLEQGNVAAIKTVGGGVSELRLHFGPGLRVYLGRDGMTLVLLLGGGSKSTQRADIAAAHAAWKAYKQRKNRGDS